MISKKIVATALSVFVIPALVLGVLIALLATSACTKSHTPTPAEQASMPKPTASPAAEKLAKKWTCPMHPQVIQDHPGRCPICGMDLTPLDEPESSTTTEHQHGHHGSHDNDDKAQAPSATEAPSGHAPVSLTMDRTQMIGVRLGKVEKKPLFKTIEASGRVAFDPELFTAQSEYVEAVKQLGRVQGSPIAEVKHSAQRMVESAKLRLKILGLSDAQIATLAAKDSVGSSLLIPNPGENLWIYAEVFEMDLPSAQPGQSVKLSGGSLGSDELPGKVVSVDRVINPATRTAKVRIQALNPRTSLRPEAFVNVSILAPLGEQVTVPFDAVLDTGKEAWVFVAGAEPGRFEPRKITVRLRAGDEVAIASGLKGGEVIVTSANFLIDSESRLKAVQATALSEGHSHQGHAHD